MDSEYARRIVAEESAKASLRPLIIALESAVDSIDGVEFAEINPDTGHIFGEIDGGQSFVVKVEVVL